MVLAYHLLHLAANASLRISRHQLLLDSVVLIQLFLVGELQTVAGNGDIFPLTLDEIRFATIRFSTAEATQKPVR